MNIDTEALLDSALLVLVGMAVVFSGLFILMVAATIVVRFSRRNGDNNTGGAERSAPEVVPSTDTGEPRGETVAAVAVALALSMQKAVIAPSERVMGAVPSPGSLSGSTWTAAGREQLMRSRGKVGHKWGRRSE